MLRTFRFFFLLFPFPFLAAAQADSLQEVKGLPTKQVYDLMIDSRQFLWVGYDEGLSRYDGISFSHFSSPDQHSRDISNLLEDRQGRTWCRNFSSQVFYIENEKMHLLKGYDFANEPVYPTLVLVGDRLVANSIKGLFICDTRTLSCSYLDCGGTMISSISKIGDKILAYGNFKWFLYDPAAGNKALPLNFTNVAGGDSIFLLQGYSYQDTAYSFSRYSGTITKLMLVDRQLKVVGQAKKAGLLHTISYSGNDVWIHSRERSTTITGDKTLNGYALTDLVIDKEGNTWFGSVKYGLMVRYKNYWKKITLPGTTAGELVMQKDSSNHINVYGTSTGRIILEDDNSKKIIRVLNVPPGAGPVLYLKAIKPSTFIIATALQIYLLKGDLTTIEKVWENLTVKNAVYTDSAVYCTAATGLYTFPFPWEHIPGVLYPVKSIELKRAKWADYDNRTHTLLVAFKDRLAEVRGNKIIPLLLNEATIVAQTLLFYRDKFYISTIGGELLTYDTSGIKKTTILDHYYSKPARQIKANQDTVWLLGNGYLVLFDPRNGQLYKNLVIPSFPDVSVYDLTWVNGKTVLLTSNGAYALQTASPGEGFSIKNYLLKIAVNGKDTVTNKALSLNYRQNNIAFFLAAPFYTNSENIYFKFRLRGSRNEEWQISSNGVDEFRFLSLSPGHYTFEAVALHSQFGIAENPISVPFTIRPAWNQTTLFNVTVILLITAVIAGFIILYFRARIRKQRAEFEKQVAIQQERQRISAEIHDDIGAGLSGLRLYTELSTNKIADPDTRTYLDKIYMTITELSAKMREVIWSLNTNNDSLEHLLKFILEQARQLFTSSPVRLQVNLPAQVPALQMGSDIRADIYLSVKEALHNVLKHAGASKVELDFSVTGSRLLISIRDDGRGMDDNDKKGNGRLNMQRRIERLGGTITIKNEKGLSVEFSIPLG